MLVLLPVLIATAMPTPLQRATPPQWEAQRSSPQRTRAALSARDSMAALRAARRAQGDFEVLRRRLLPTQPGLSSRSCDVVVGRYCHWRGLGAGPPDEAPQVIARREGLLALLDSIGELLPNDRWILAQKLRYHLEAGRSADAERVATSCVERTRVSATRSWCRALAGYAAQERGDYMAADAAFASALAEMSAEERCAWQDLSLLLDGAARGRYRSLSCAARDSMATSLWHLVQPLYLTGVNDLRTEFLARMTRVNIERDTRTPLSASQRADDRETLLRFGGGLWYAQEEPAPGSTRAATIASFRKGPAFNFFPLSKALVAPEQLSPDHWDLEGPTPRTRYAPGYAQQFHHVTNHQLAVFRRGDSALIVAAFDVTDNAAFIDGSLRAGVYAAALERGGVSRPQGVSVEDAPPRFISSVRAPWRPLVVSIEVLNDASRSAGRARYSVHLPATGGRIGLSDLLLYTPRDSTPRSLAAAMPVALHAARVSRSRPLGLFWETYGVRESGETFGVALLVEPVGKSWLRRTFQVMRLADKDKLISLQWQEVSVPSNGIASRALSVDLSPLKPGSYRVRLTVTPTGGAPIVVMRTVEVTP
jgi:hypothetical protein